VTIGQAINSTMSQQAMIQSEEIHSKSIVYS